MPALPPFMHTASVTLSGLSFTAIQQIFLAEGVEHNLPIVINADRQIVCQTPVGNITASATQNGLEVCVLANTSESLFMLKDHIVTRLSEAMPEMARNIRWSDGEAMSQFPQNFRFALVRDIQPLSQQFSRVTLQTQEIDSYANEAIHFQMCIRDRSASDANSGFIDQRSAHRCRW